MNQSVRCKKITSILICVFFIFIGYLFLLEITGQVPEEYNISVGDDFKFEYKFPLSYSIKSNDDSIVKIIRSNSDHNQVFMFGEDLQLKTLEKGTTHLQLKLFGLVPYKTVKVNVVPKLHVIPGGQSIGVKLNTDGVLVVGVAEIVDENGIRHNLADKGGIKIGDSLIKINGQKVEDAEHVIKLIEKSRGKNMKLTLKRNGREYTTFLTPVKSQKDKKYRLGLWVRDKTAGVGTITFYHPITRKFGALGHAITDIDTGALLSVREGEIIKSRVVSILQGKRGRPGEIRGVFYEINNPLGKLEKNTRFGVYGELYHNLENSDFNQPIPIAYQHEIQEGPAYILTTVDDNRVEKYSIEILRINNQGKADGKSMVIRITDKRLLESTGGIVQGMSGSPILQNGKVVGAVTHVLINDPAKGYGIFIEWMLEESGLLENYNKNVVEKKAN